MYKIEELYAFVTSDEEGEGIMGFMSPNNNWVPLIGADMTRVDDLREIAQQISAASGKPYKLLHFKLVGELMP